jgi:hypothetical protein
MDVVRRNGSRIIAMALAKKNEQELFLSLLFLSNTTDGW